MDLSHSLPALILASLQRSGPRQELARSSASFSHPCILQFAGCISFQHFCCIDLCIPQYSACILTAVTSISYSLHIEFLRPASLQPFCIHSTSLHLHYNPIASPEWDASLTRELHVMRSLTLHIITLVAGPVWENSSTCFLPLASQQLKLFNTLLTFRYYNRQGIVI